MEWKSEVVEVNASQTESVDVNKLKSLDDFFNGISNNKIEPQLSKGKRKRKQNDAFKNKKPMLNIQENLIQIALERSLEDEVFFSKDALFQLIQTKCIGNGLLEILINIVIKYRVVDIFAALEENHILPTSSQIIKTIKFIMSGTDLTKCLSPDDTIPDDLIKELSFISNMSFEELSMKSYLKLLTTNEAVVFLNFLNQALHMHSFAFSTFKDSEKPKETKLMKWIDALLAAHLLSFVAAPALVTVVASLRKTVFKMKSYYREVSRLQPYLTYLQKSYKLPVNNIGVYSYETICI